MGIKKVFELNGKQYEVDRCKNVITITQENGESCEYQLTQVKNKQESPAIMHLLINNRMHVVSYDLTNNKFLIHGQEYNVQSVLQVSSNVKNNPFKYKPASSPQTFDGLIKSPLAGRVIRVLSSTGTEVSKGQPLIVIESMKMENEICAGSDGIIKTLFIALGNLVQPNQLLVELEMKGGHGGEPEGANGQETI